MRIYPLLLCCFFISGATALVYEVIWVRLLALTFGNTVYAIGIVLTTFMSGLSLGSFVLGRWADRGKNLLVGYGLLEFGIAASALASPYLLDAVSALYLSLSVTEMPLWTVLLIKYVLSGTVMLIPTTLMGGTLPVLSRYIIRSEDELEEKISILYALNTIGGVLGTFLVGFILIRLFGLETTLQVTAAVNVAIGGIACYLGLRRYVSLKEETGIETIAEKREPGYGYAMVAFFFSGFAAMVYQIAWSRLLVGVIGSTTYSFSIILIGFLSGIGIGSLIVARIAPAKRLGLVHFSFIEIAIGLVCLSTLLVFNVLPAIMWKGLQVTGESYMSVLMVKMLLVFFYMLIPTTLFGATFPVIASIYSGGSRHRGRNIGNIYAANTMGAILGSSTAAFLLLPHFGATLSIKFASLINLLIGLAGLYLLGNKRALAFTASLVVLIALPVKITDDALVSGVAVYGKRTSYSLTSEDHKFIFLKEGLHANIAVTTNKDGSITLSTNGKADGSSGDDMSTQTALAYFPLLLHNGPEDVFVIGLGTGVTVRAAADFKGVQRVDAVEIEPAVIEAARFFKDQNRDITNDPKVRIFLDDARSHLVASKGKYDVIISEPSNPWISGIGNLFSREFFQMSSDKLNEGGVFCQWVQLYGLRSSELKMIVRTFSSVFPHSTIWHSNPADILLIGSAEKLDLNERAVSLRLRGNSMHELRTYLHIYDPMDLFAYYISGRDGVASFGEHADMNTDDLPLLEFNAPFSLYADTTLSNLKLLQGLQSVPAISGYDDINDLTGQFYFRKIVAYRKLHIPIDNRWLSEIPPEMNNYIMNRDLALNYNYPGRQGALKHALNYDSMRFGSDYEDYDLLFAAVYQAMQDMRHEDLAHYLERAEHVPQHQVRHSQLYYNVAERFLDMNRRDEAMKYLGKSAETNPYSAAPLRRLGDIYASLNKTPQACRYYSNAADLLLGKRKDDVESRMALIPCEPAE